MHLVEKAMQTKMEAIGGGCSLISLFVCFFLFCHSEGTGNPWEGNVDRLGEQSCRKALKREKKSAWCSNERGITAQTGDVQLLVMAQCNKKQNWKNRGKGFQKVRHFYLIRS